MVPGSCVVSKVCAHRTRRFVFFGALPLPTWKVVSVHAACRTNHFRTALPKPIVAMICRSVKSLIARISPWMVWFVLSMLPLALLYSTGLSSWTMSVGMCVPALFDVDDAGILAALL